MIKFKHKKYSESLLKSRLRRFLAEMNESEYESGMNWYALMNQWCEGVSESYKIPMFKVCGVFAALSPQTAVDFNKELCIEYFDKGTARQIGFLVRKCDDIMQAKTKEEVKTILSGNKITAFYINILDCDVNLGCVTVDRHAIACLIQTPATVEAISDKNSSMTNNQYKYFESIYISLANEIGILPQQLQAITWEVYRRLRGLKQYDYTPF